LSGFRFQFFIQHIFGHVGVLSVEYTGTLSIVVEANDGRRFPPFKFKNVPEPDQFDAHKLQGQMDTFRHAVHKAINRKIAAGRRNPPTGWIIVREGWSPD
tara:strand:+ start:6024 stop:6323 length:300 start_codon:yes stop_codon:yes gene_type:complete